MSNWIINSLFITIFRFNIYLSKYPRVPKLQNSQELILGYVSKNYKKKEFRH